MTIDGVILKGIGGFYYVEAAGEVYECKARGAFRKKKMKLPAQDELLKKMKKLSKSRS